MSQFHPLKENKIKVEITKKQYELLEFIKNELPFGKCLLITHNGEPQRVEEPRKIKFFGNEDKTLDKGS